MHACTQMFPLPHSLRVLLRPSCPQRYDSPHSLHAIFSLSCLQMDIPPHCLHVCTWISCCYCCCACKWMSHRTPCIMTSIYHAHRWMLRRNPCTATSLYHVRTAKSSHSICHLPIRPSYPGTFCLFSSIPWPQT